MLSSLSSPAAAFPVRQHRRSDQLIQFVAETEPGQKSRGSLSLVAEVVLIAVWIQG